MDREGRHEEQQARVMTKGIKAKRALAGLSRLTGIAIVVLVVAGCGGAQKKDAELVWPLPPEPPRIKWVKSISGPEDITAQGARVTKASADRARQRAVDLYEELLNIASPASPEAHAAELALPRLKLKLDTGERTFFCFSC